MVGGVGAAGVGGGKVEEVFEEYLDAREAGGGGCEKLGGEVVQPGALGLLVGFD